MRFVGFALVGALLSAGCALQTGDPSVDETQRPGELVSEPGGGGVTGVTARTAAAQDKPTNLSGSGDQAHSGWSVAPAGSTGGPTGPKDNPNPSPWGDGVNGPVDLSTGTGK